MRRAFGAIELLIAIIVIIVIYFACFHSQFKNSNPLVENVNDIKTKQQQIDDKLNEIEKTRQLQQKIEKDMSESY